MSIYNEQTLSFNIWKISKLYKSTPLLIIAGDVFTANNLVKELKFFLHDKKVSYFPDTELLPYERLSISKELILNRLKLLWQLSLNQVDILVINPSTLQSLLCPVSYLYNSLIVLKINDTLPIQILKKRLLAANYNLVEQVMESGEFTVRGGIIDLIPTGTNLFIRIELFDDQIESIKSIDKLTQSVINTYDEFQLIPSKEFPINSDSLNSFRHRFNQYFPTHTSVHSDLKNNILPSGSEFYLPLFFDKCSSIFDYLDSSWSIVCFDNLKNDLNINWSIINQRYQLNHDAYPCIEPNGLYLSADEVLKKIKHYKIYPVVKDSKDFKSLPDVSINTKKMDPYASLRDLKKNISQPLIIVFNSLGRLQIFSQEISKFNFSFNIIENINSPVSKDKFNLVCGDMYNSFITNNFCLISENDLYKNDYSITKKKSIMKAMQLDSSVQEIADIKIGDFIVHKNYGIAKYQGLNTQIIDNIKYEMIVLEYNNQSKLMIPIQNLYLINKYNTPLNNIEIPLDTLGAKNWDKIKNRINKKIEDTAAQLLELYAKREMKDGYKFSVPKEYEDFSKSFLYQLTPDQETAIKNVIDDMTKKKPMDRLICGDVGFGKTEVALRAAFICAMNRKQVAFLCPTTLLTEQHYNNFINRFANFNVTVKEVSRFKSKKEILETLKLLELGKIDILIGTSRLIQKDIKFNDLGLVIIDEEHRFGVNQKEVLKEMKHNVDFLTLTATPIPRTLSMALEGLRDFSIIASPPKRRLPINTILIQDSDLIFKEAVTREIKRGGQVFFLYNNIANIETIKNRLINLFPELNIEVAHAQMHEKKLESIVKDFINQKFHILICSTIIENGIDIPNANTIIIYSADHFGLAQLYQIRGRVGRSHHQAYCYLVINEKVSSKAEKKLEALKSTSELGSGFNLATYDLEIRGAGDILGVNQSGSINQMGLSLYSETLRKTINKLKSIDAFIEEDCEVVINETTVIPENYCHDIKTRIYYYKILSNTKNIEEVNSIYSKIIDDYGMPPIELTNLIHLNYLRIHAQSIGVKSITITNDKIIIAFSTKPKVCKNVTTILSGDQSIRFNNDKIVKSINLKSAKQKFEEAEKLIEMISEKT